MAFKEVRVTLKSIKNAGTGPDPGDELEIFGRITVGKQWFAQEVGETISGHFQNVFDHSRDQALEIVGGQSFNFPPEHNSFISISDGEDLLITSRLGEADTFGADDFFPNINMAIPFNDIRNQTMVIPLDESDQKIEVTAVSIVERQG